MEYPILDKHLEEPRLVNHGLVGRNILQIHVRKSIDLRMDAHAVMRHNIFGIADT